MTGISFVPENVNQKPQPFLEARQKVEAQEKFSLSRARVKPSNEQVAAISRSESGSGLQGDYNGDGIVNINDITALQEYIDEKVAAFVKHIQTGEYSSEFDFNQDKKISLLDVAELRAFLDSKVDELVEILSSGSSEGSSDGPELAVLGPKIQASPGDDDTAPGDDDYIANVQKFVDILLSGEYHAGADFNGDQVVNLLDVEPFITFLKKSGALSGKNLEVAREVFPEHFPQYAADVVSVEPSKEQVYKRFRAQTLSELGYTEDSLHNLADKLPEEDYQALLARIEETIRKKVGSFYG